MNNKEIIKNLLACNNQLVEPLNAKLQAQIVTLQSLTYTQKELKENKRLLERKNQQLETELRKYESISAKNSDMFSKLSNQRLKLNKELVEEEIKNEELEEELNKLKELVINGRKMIENLRLNLHDKIFLELVKGLGVFENDGVVTIKNEEKMEMKIVKENDDLEDVWEFIA